MILFFRKIEYNLLFLNFFFFCKTIKIKGGEWGEGLNSTMGRYFATLTAK